MLLQMMHRLVSIGVVAVVVDGVLVSGPQADRPCKKEGREEGGCYCDEKIEQKTFPLFTMACFYNNIIFLLLPLLTLPVRKCVR